MKPVALLVASVAILGLAAGSAIGASLDRDGTWTPSEYHQSTGSDDLRTLINDGSFELGPPPASAWTEVSAPGVCEWIGDFSGQWYMSAWDGYFDYWAGGYCYDENTGLNLPVTSSVTQAVHVPQDETRLSFFYASFRPDFDDNPPDGDHVYVAVNGVEVWTLELLRANDTYPYWVGPTYVDLDGYAGQDIQLTFGGVSVGDMTGNVRFDYIEFIPGPPPTAATSTTWGAVRALYR